jgi:hypothetical protein
MAAEPLAYEHVPTHRGRFRVQDSPEALEIELVPLPALSKVPGIIAFWTLTGVPCALMWWAHNRTGPIYLPESRLILITLAATVGALGATLFLIAYGRQRLIITVDKTGVTIVRHMLGGPDRQFLALNDLLAVTINSEDHTTIGFITRIGGASVPIFRRPRYVTEIHRLLVARIAELRQIPIEALSRKRSYRSSR